MEERRRYRRTPKRIRLEFRKKGFLFLQGPKDVAEAVDISSTGVRLNTQMSLQKGERVRLLLRGSPDEKEVGFSGRVIWTRVLREKGETFTQAGIEFVRLGLKQRVLLVRLATGL